MNFIELNGHSGKYLYDFDSGWEIYDKGDGPAAWGNNREGRNLHSRETYADIRERIAKVSPMLRATAEIVGSRDE